MNTTVRLLLRYATMFGIAVFTTVFLWSCKKADPEEETKEKKTWKLSMIKYEELRQTEDAERGFREGLDAAGLREGIDYEIVTRNAQGDLSSVLAMIDATAVDGTDMIVSLQTPTLHAAVMRGEGLPLVFMVVANPFVISTVGSSDTDHLPYLTGVYTNTTFDEMMKYIKAVAPQVHTIGTLFTPEEQNAIFYLNALKVAGTKAGFKVEQLGVSHKTSVPQATQSLIDRGVQAICQIEDNMTSATFGSIIRVAQENRIPVFSFVNEQARQGSVIVVAPDYVQGARIAADFTARIIRGEDPKDIPLARIQKFDHIVNLKAARELGLEIPADIIQRADLVLEDEAASAGR